MYKKRNRRKRIKIAAIITFVSLVAVSIAFAALQQTLNISFGSVSQNSVSWNVGFKGSSVTPTSSGTSDTGLTCGNATVTPTTVTISQIVLSKPDDKCSYNLTIENNGDVPAGLNNITNVYPTDTTCTGSTGKMICGNITYELLNTSGSALETGTIINPSSEYNFKLVVSYTGEELNGSTSSQNSAKFILNYQQSDTGSEVEEPVDDTRTICKRATSLHTEICSKSNGGCYYNQYYVGSNTHNTPIITYGNLGTQGTLASGDAFDCDVNGDGVYDAINERFYYLSGADGDATSDYAALIYYSNVYNGELDAASVTAYGSGSNKGPDIAYLHLPTTAQWSNVSLSNTTRTIYSDFGTAVVNSFNYAERAARLMTYKEVKEACGVTLYGNSSKSTSHCDYIFERSTFSNDTSAYTRGYWLENPVNSAFVNYIWATEPQNSTFTKNYSYASASYIGVRPVIEVKKTNMDY